MRPTGFIFARPARDGHILILPAFFLKPNFDYINAIPAFTKVPMHIRAPVPQTAVRIKLSRCELIDIYATLYTILENK